MRKALTSTASRDSITLGLAVRDLRLTLRWTQAELGRRAGFSQPSVSELERGLRPDVSFGVIGRMLGAMGGRLAWTVEAPYLADRMLQRDPGHARCLTYAASRLRAAGWEVSTEVEVGGDRSRGWIDILACHEPTGTMLVVEVKTELHDLGAIERTLGWYEREAWRAARRLGWRPGRAAGVLLLLATRSVEERLAANRRAIAASFPGRATGLAEIVARGCASDMTGSPRRFVAVIDPLSRRSRWLRSLRLDGRHTLAPYVDYADFTSRYQGRSRRPPSSRSIGAACRRYRTGR